MSLRLTASRLAPRLAQRSVWAAVGTTTTANSGVFAWTQHRGRRTMSTSSSPWSETLHFSSPESDFSMALENTPAPATRPAPLPRTWATALHETHAALVITTARPPYTVVHANAAWESLCGYTRDEALDRPIGPLLQQDTHQSHTHTAARHLIDQLQADHYTTEHEAYLENFTREGRSFLNHLRVGPLYLASEPALAHDEPEFLVAVLEEVQRDQVPLRMVV